MVVFDGSGITSVNTVIYAEWSRTHWSQGCWSALMEVFYAMARPDTSSTVAMLGGTPISGGQAFVVDRCYQCLGIQSSHSFKLLKAYLRAYNISH
jgi:hypothetical protein